MQEDYGTTLLIHQQDYTKTDSPHYNTSSDTYQFFWKKLFWFLKAYSSALIKTRMKNIALLTYTWFMAKHFYCFSKFCQYFTKVRIVISDDYSSNIVYSIFIYQNKVHTY